MDANSLFDMKKNYNERFPPNRLKYLMDINKIEKADLADTLNTTEETIRRWMVGESDLNHSKMVALAKIFDCEPYELIADKEEIVQRESTYIAHHRRIVDAYLGLAAEDKPFVDRFMFPEKKIPPEGLLPNSKRPFKEDDRKRKA